MLLLTTGSNATSLIQTQMANMRKQTYHFDKRGLYVKNNNRQRPSEQNLISLHDFDVDDMVTSALTMNYNSETGMVEQKTDELKTQIRNQQVLA